MKVDFFLVALTDNGGRWMRMLIRKTQQGNAKSKREVELFGPKGMFWVCLTEFAASVFFVRLHVPRKTNWKKKFSNENFLLTPSGGPVDGGWTSWGQWTTCSQPCHGLTQRTRYCTNPTGGGPCPGHSSETRNCHFNSCQRKLNLVHWTLNFSLNSVYSTLIVRNSVR